MELNLLAAKFARHNKLVTCLDCGGRDDEIPVELFENLDYLSPNETELERIIGNINSEN